VNFIKYYDAIGGAHGVLCLATQTSAFQTGLDMCRRKGTFVCVALPNGTFDCPIVDVVLKRVTIRGSIVGTRQDMTEALDFAERGLVTCSVQLDRLENVNDVFAKMKNGQILGRVVIQM